MFIICRFKETTFNSYFKCMSDHSLYPDDYLYKILNNLQGSWFEKIPNLIK